MNMPRYYGALVIVLLIGMVLTRVLLLKKKGVEAMNFGKIDKTDFLIPPFALFYFYLIFANAFSLPSPSRQAFFHSNGISWVGVILCLAGLVLFFLSLLSFRKSFRVGIDNQHPDQLITTGIFALTRNPIYVSLGIILSGQFLIFSNWILLVFLAGAIWLFHRQVLREEEFMKQYYGEEFAAYCHHVRRYI
jgi:protein-S-isoprenylcysteine O-methyltransferase Ste14